MSLGASTPQGGSPGGGSGAVLLLVFALEQILDTLFVYLKKRGRGPHMVVMVGLGGEIGGTSGIVECCALNANSAFMNIDQIFTLLE